MCIRDRVYIVMVISVTFNIMGAGHRFQLWRIDANRIKIETQLQEALKVPVTLDALDQVTPEARHQSPQVKAALTTSISALNALRKRCRKQSVSMLVPMGQEMGYRFQEEQIDDLLMATRAFQDKLQA